MAKTNGSPEQEARYAIHHGIPRRELSVGAQLVYDQLTTRQEVTYSDADPLAGIEQRSSPEARARILAMFKNANSKYAKPFSKDRLAWTQCSAATGRSTGRSSCKWPYSIRCCPSRRSWIGSPVASPARISHPRAAMSVLMASNQLSNDRLRRRHTPVDVSGLFTTVQKKDAKANTVDSIP